MKRLAIVLGLIVVGCVLDSCNASITLVVPYCPVSDSARTKADSAPLGCPARDTTRKQP